MALYIIPTPIGNLEDISFRIIDTLKKVDYILCETPLISKRMLNHYKIETPVKNYREDSHDRVYPYVIADLKSGKNIALISDAGTPVVSDPGIKLLREVYKEKLLIIPLPGPSAVTTAISVFPVPSPKFLFVGFFPRKSGEVKRLIEGSFLQMTKEKTSIVFFESPLRVVKSLGVIKGIQDSFVKQNKYFIQVGICREATKMHESYIWISLDDLVSQETLLKEISRGELTIVLSLLKLEKYE